MKITHRGGLERSRRDNYTSIWLYHCKFSFIFSIQIGVIISNHPDVPMSLTAKPNLVGARTTFKLADEGWQPLGYARPHTGSTCEPFGRAHAAVQPRTCHTRPNVSPVTCATTALWMQRNQDWRLVRFIDSFKMFSVAASRYCRYFGVVARGKRYTVSSYS